MEAKLTAAEIGKLWATYMGNSMSERVVSYFLQQVDDQDIRGILEQALQLTQQFTQGVRDVLSREQCPIPIGLTGEDVDLDAPRLFEDEFYVHYVKYVGKAGINLYGTAVPLMTRKDTRDFFTNCLNSTVQLMNNVNELSATKGYLIKPPYIPKPSTVEFIKKQSYLNGFFGEVRPLQALEITHLWDDAQNDSISRSVLLGFSQVAQLNQVRDYFLRGKKMIEKHLEVFSEKLMQAGLPSHPVLDHLVTTSTTPPFSDKLMMFHKIDMFAMRIRTYGNSASFSARHDLAAVFGRFLVETGNYVEDGANIIIDHGWLEQPPQAPDRHALARK